VGCTYKLLSKKARDGILDLFPKSAGDGRFCPELMIWLTRREFKMVEIPVNYLPRIGESQYTGTTWKAFKLGLEMVWLIFIYRFRMFKK
jgi:hypothetical protein